MDLSIIEINQTAALKLSRNKIDQLRGLTQLTSLPQIPVALTDTSTHPSGTTGFPSDDAGNETGNCLTSSLSRPYTTSDGFGREILSDMMYLRCKEVIVVPAPHPFRC